MKITFRSLLIAAFFITASTKINAQVTISAGPEIGFTASGLYSNGQADVYAGANFHFGGTANVQFGRFLAIRPSALLKLGSMKQADFTDQKISLTRLSVPVPVMFSYIFRNNSNLFVGAGPNFQYTLAGKMKSGSESSNISFGSGAEEMKRFDMGLHIKGGYQFPIGISLSTFANIGFSNLGNTDYNKLKSLDAIGFSIGYMFGGGEED